MTAATAPVTTPQSQDGALRANFIAQLVQQGLLFLLFAGLATSRAAGHVLSAGAITGVVMVGAATSAVLAWTTSLYSGAFAVLTGSVAATPDEFEGTDPFATGPLWRTTLAWSAGAGAWAAAGAGLVAVALNGKLAGFVTIFVAMAALMGVSVVAISGAARRRGMAAAHASASTTTGLRRRAWRSVAFPYAVSQGVLNAGVAWLLFHDYGKGLDVLTEKAALADALLVVVPLTILFGGMTRSMGAFDMATGRVVLDDPETQTVPQRSPIGLQFVVYMSFVGLLLFRFAAFVLPAQPSLTQVIVTRGVLATVLVFLAAGVGYVRGAVNGLKPGEVVA